MEDIEWKDIKGFERLYKISNYGHIKKIYKNKNKILVSNNKKNEIRLVNNKKKYTKFIIHNLVIEHFISELLINIKKIIHIDGNIHNNYYKNLKIIFTKKYKNQIEKKNKKEIKNINQLDKEDEEWKDLLSFEGIYKISNYGRIKLINNAGVEERIIRANNPKNEVKLIKNGVNFYRNIQNLVATHFITTKDEEKNIYKIIYIDGNKKNNYYKNLKIIYNKKYEKTLNTNNAINIEDKEDEIWKNIVNFEGLYQISNYGKIKKKINNEWIIINKNNINKTKKIIKLVKKDIKINKLIHHLVAEHFIHTNNFGYKVKHIDGDFNNNYYKNLEWVPFKNEKIVETNNTENEIWKSIEDYDGYFISNLGNVKSLRRNKEHILKPKINTRGYYTISVRKNTKRCYLIIHRLVASHFIKNSDPINKIYVDHIDRNKFNNRESNLRWVTTLENSHNLSKFKNNTSGYTGVYKVKNEDKWFAQICINKKNTNLGRFNTFEEAKNARIEAEKKYYIIKE